MQDIVQIKDNCEFTSKVKQNAIIPGAYICDSTNRVYIKCEEQNKVFRPFDGKTLLASIMQFPIRLINHARTTNPSKTNRIMGVRLPR